jgi:EAL domain-containing protein (putative c-di-GMP-specific phosphodiesterase class I)
VLCLEITESAVAGEPESALDTLRGLEALGVLLSLDDFGTGLSSLGALDRYPLDMLKIDRMFVGRLESGLSGQRLFAAVVGVARGLGLRAIAEGVETNAQLVHIARVGCDTVQGFYLCRPSPPEAVEPRLLAFPDRASV